MTTQIQTAIRILSRHDKGRDTLRHLLAWLDSSGCSLDQLDAQAVLGLLQAAWGGYAGTVLEELREVVGEPASLAKRTGGA